MADKNKEMEKLLKKVLPDRNIEKIIRRVEFEHRGIEIEEFIALLPCGYTLLWVRKPYQLPFIDGRPNPYVQSVIGSKMTIEAISEARARVEDRFDKYHHEGVIKEGDNVPHD